MSTVGNSRPATAVDMKVDEPGYEHRTTAVDDLTLERRRDARPPSGNKSPLESNPPVLGRRPSGNDRDALDE